MSYCHLNHTLGLNTGIFSMIQCYQEVNKKISKGWGQLDSNQRRPKSTDLQSIAIGRYAMPPLGVAGSRNRTHNRPITNRVLYQLSYASKIMENKLSNKLIYSQGLFSFFCY